MATFIRRCRISTKLCRFVGNWWRLINDRVREKGSGRIVSTRVNYLIAESSIHFCILRVRNFVRRVGKVVTLMDMKRRTRDVVEVVAMRSDYPIFLFRIRSITTCSFRLFNNNNRFLMCTIKLRIVTRRTSPMYLLPMIRNEPIPMFRRVNSKDVVYMRVLPRLIIMKEGLNTNVPTSTLYINFRSSMVIINRNTRRIANVDSTLTILFVLCVIVSVSNEVLRLPRAFRLICVVRIKRGTINSGLIFALMFVCGITLPVRGVNRFLPIVTFPFVLMQKTYRSVTQVRLFPNISIRSPMIRSPFLNGRVRIVIRFLFSMIPRSRRVISIICSTHFYFIIRLVPSSYQVLYVSFRRLTSGPFTVRLMNQIYGVRILSSSVVNFISFNIFYRRFQIFMYRPYEGKVNKDSRSSFSSYYVRLIRGTIRPFGFGVSFLQLGCSPNEFSGTRCYRTNSFRRPSVFVRSLVKRVFVVMNYAVGRIIR